MFNQNVDHSRSYTALTVHQTVALPSVRPQLVLRPGLYEIQGDLRPYLGGLPERRKAAAGIYSVQYYPYGTPDTPSLESATSKIPLETATTESVPEVSAQTVPAVEVPVVTAIDPVPTEPVPAVTEVVLASTEPATVMTIVDPTTPVSTETVVTAITPPAPAPIAGEQVVQAKRRTRTKAVEA